MVQGVGVLFGVGAEEPHRYGSFALELGTVSPQLLEPMAD